MNERDPVLRKLSAAAHDFPEQSCAVAESLRRLPRLLHNPFDFGAWLRFDAATVTKIKISPGPPRVVSTP
jgi:hypothetical protein